MIKVKLINGPLSDRILFLQEGATSLIFNAIDNDKINWTYKHDIKEYHVFVAGEKIFSTASEVEKDKFIDELKNRPPIEYHIRQDEAGQWIGETEDNGIIAPVPINQPAQYSS